MYAPIPLAGRALMDRRHGEAGRIGPTGPSNRIRTHQPPRLRIGRGQVFVALVCLVLAAGCSTTGNFELIDGSGRTTTEQRPVADFDRISIAGGGEVVVEVTGRESLVVEADDNLLDVLTVEVVDRELRLGVAPYVNIEPTRPVVYRITAQRLDGVSVSGSATVDAAVVDSSSFIVSIDGSGRVVPHGTASDLNVRIGGSGRFDGEGLTAQHGTVNVAGSGGALVRVTGDLEASVSGSGRIRYLGDPAVHSSVSGSGSITEAGGGGDA